MSPKPSARSLSRVAAKARRAILGRRRLLAALFAGVAVFAGLRAAAAPPPPTTPVLVTVRDLPAGATIGAGDVVWRDFTPESVPTGVLDRDAVTGRLLAGPIRAGEPVTDAALIGPGLAEPGRVVTPVRITDAESVTLLTVGDRVDLVATDLQGGVATRVATGVAVLALPPADPASGDGLPGRLIVVGLEPATVASVTAASTQDALGFNFGR